EADAIAKRIPALEKVEIEQGAFGGRPPRPAESFETLAFSVRLVTAPKSDPDKIAELVKQLYQIRQNISAAVPGAGLMETPDLVERDADAAFDAVYTRGIKDELSASALTSFNLGFAELHRCITARRAALVGG